MATQSFSPRRVVVTFSLQQRLAESIPDSWEEELARMLNRHIGDWGDMDQSEQELNDNALSRVMKNPDFAKNSRPSR